MRAILRFGVLVLLVAALTGCHHRYPQVPKTLTGSVPAPASSVPHVAARGR